MHCIWFYHADVPGAVDFGDKASLDILQRVNHTGKVPIFSLMIVLKSPAPGQTIDAATVTGSDVIQWLSRDTSKPGEQPIYMSQGYCTVRLYENVMQELGLVMYEHAPQKPKEQEYTTDIRAAKIKSANLELIAGRERDDDQECWVAVSTRAFGEKLQSKGVQSPDEAVPALQEEFLKLLGVLAKGDKLPGVTSAHAMKWGCAFRKEVIKDRSLLDTENGIGACGDYCVESLAEGALLSAHHLANQILHAK